MQLQDTKTVKILTHFAHYMLMLKTKKIALQNHFTRVDKENNERKKKYYRVQC